MDVSNKVVFFVVVSVLQLAISNVVAMEYLVGDENGWDINTDYKKWAKDKVFRVGDSLVFEYTPGDHNVVRVKRDAFKSCMANPSSEPLTSGRDVIELTKPGRKWFISSIGDQCSVGNQKLVITVFPSNYFSRKPYFSRWTAPAPSPNFEYIWKLFFPPSSAPAPAPGYNFNWRMFFPPSAAPAPAPTSNFPWWGMFFPPSAAPAPAPTSPFPWKWMFPQAPAPAPYIGFQEDTNDSSDE